MHFTCCLSIASSIGKCADMPLNVSGSADCADTVQPGSQFADPGDRQEFNTLSCVTQGKQETEASPLTPSWLQVKPGGTPATPRADQRAALGETRVAAARSPGSARCVARRTPCPSVIFPQQHLSKLFYVIELGRCSVDGFQEGAVRVTITGK